MHPRQRTTGNTVITKAQIDKMSYEQLLRKWRSADFGDPIFIGPLGEYYQTVMLLKRDKIGRDEACKISKAIGWKK